LPYKGRGPLGRNVKRFQLVTGYVLLQDVWLQHSWVVDGGMLYDATEETR